jgi:hypothetical protein
MEEDWRFFGGEAARRVAEGEGTDEDWRELAGDDSSDEPE